MQGIYHLPFSSKKAALPHRTTLISQRSRQADPSRVDWNFCKWGLKEAAAEMIRFSEIIKSGPV